MMAGWWNRLFGCSKSEAGAKQRMRELRRVTDMNFAESCNANRLKLDIVEQELRSKSAIEAMVEVMVARGRNGQSH